MVATLRPEGLSTAALLRAHCRLLLRALPPVERGERVVLMNWPNHGNAGDHLIALATLRWLAARGAQVACVQGHDASDMRALGRAAGDGLVVVSGGGNLGGLWPQTHGNILHALRDLRRNRVAILPQSIEFCSRADARETARALAAHPMLHLMARDRASIATLRGLGFDGEVALAPDMSMLLAGRIASPGDTPIPALFLKRGDREGAPWAAAWRPRGVEPREDWRALGDQGLFPEFHGGTRLAARRPRTWRWLLQGPPRRRGVRWMTGDGDAARAAAISRAAVASAIRQLAPARLVVSDRLHAALLALLLGRPALLLAGTSAKGRAYFEAWLAGLAQARLATCAAEADAALAELGAQP